MGYFQLTAIICTHNPQKKYIAQVLEALQKQTLEKHLWELVVVDNASDKNLSSSLELSWHPNAQVVHEPKLGLTNARLCGIQKAEGEIIVFVDDDNVLSEDYLETAISLQKIHPELGAWGGQTFPEFEEVPPTWTERYWSLIGIRTFEQDRISSEMDWFATPIGAGMCVRKDVALKYVQSVSQDSRRQLLGRNAEILLSCEDLDLAYTALDVGYQIGIFKDLKLNHLIPKSRLEEAYLQQIIAGTEYSTVMLKYIRDKTVAEVSWSQRIRLRVPWLINPEYWFADRQVRQLGFAATKGRLMAIQTILNFNTNSI